jgi:uncharacterized Zn finger protein (UPF0148 family)
MQSEMACHVGMMGRMFCRICKVVGKLTTGNVEEAMGPAADDSSDSASTIASDIDADNKHQNSKGKRAKKTETITEAIKRVTRFMQVRVFT